MVCPACGSSSEATPICPGCGAVLDVTAREEPSRPGAAAATPDVPSSSVWADEPVDPTAARCGKHPALLATGTCTRCGRFVCVTCAPGSLTSTAAVECDDCLGRARLEQAPKRLSRYRAELVFSLVTMALFVAGIVATFIPSTRPTTRVGLLVMATPVFVLLLASGVLLGITRRRLFAWIGVAVEALVVLPVFFLAPSVCTGVLVAVPIYSLVRTLQLGELERLINPSP